MACTKHKINRLLLFAIAICSLPLAAFTKAPVSFAGTYVAIHSNSNKTGPPVTLKIVQTASKIEFSHEEDGKTTTSTFPLNGTDGTYTTPAGLAGKGRATWHGSDLLIETFVAPSGDSPIHFHSKERWQLSANAKVLKVHVAVDSPDRSAEIVEDAVPPFTLVYTRTAQP